MDNLRDKKSGASVTAQDCALMRGTLERYGITDVGPLNDENENLYVVNDNATAAKMREVMKSIKDRIKSDKEKNYLVIYVLAGHRMMTAGK